MPAISICLPVYNGAQFLERAIESVLAQTHSDFELLIADDVSIDASAAIAQNYAAKDSRIIFWTNPKNVGLFANYNKCLERAQGKLIKPFAQDDLLYPKCLEILKSALDNNVKASLVSCARDLIAADNFVIKKTRPFEADRQINGRDVILWHLIQLSNWIGEPSTVMFSANNKGAGFNTNFYHFGDIEYWFRILENGNYVYVDQPLCAFRRHALSASSANHSSLRFALDALRLGHLYARYLESIGETQAHFHKRLAEYVAVQIDHLVKEEGLSVEQFTGQEVGKDIKTLPVEIRSELAGLKEILVHSSEYMVELLHELDHLKRCRQGDHANFEREVAKLQSTFSWKITEPLRKVRSMFKNEGEEQSTLSNPETIDRSVH
jgi:glycosyltransferase involved in cell wall biosynthesis